jgi:hypothetical protein
VSLVNTTRHAAQDAVTIDQHGREVVVVIVKATFEIAASGAMVPVAEPSGVRLGDVVWREDDPKTSLRFPGELCTRKVGTDVVVVGSARSNKPVTVMDVAVTVRDATVPLRVHGERTFRRGIGDVVVGAAAPFVETPIVYENAYGGQTADHKVYEPRNFSGVGVAHRPDDLVGTPAPRIEHPARPHKSASDKHAPVGFGAIWSYWSPRRELFGTMDQAWTEERMPIPPVDFDERANNVAHPSLVFERHLVPGDPIAVSGMTAEGLLRFMLPAVNVRVSGRSDVSGRSETRPPIDTIIVVPDERRVELVMRRTFSRGRGRDVLREIRVETHDVAA